jgi:prevent-host-death family protein
MRSINIHAAKTHLSRLVEEAAQGEPFVIAKAGKPMVVVTRIEKQTAAGKRRLGGLEGMYTVPEDFKSIFADEIEEMFYGGGKEE